MDDTTLDKPYAREMELVHRHWSGKHRRVVSGINLATLLWSDGEALVPTDFRVYDKPQDGLTKNEHFRLMLEVAKEERGFRPSYVLFDSWYASLENLKTIRGYGWGWMWRLKSNRLVSPDESGNNVAINEIAITPEGRVVHLKGYGMVKVFRTVARDGGAEHWATNDPKMSEESREELELRGWGIEAERVRGYPGAWVAGGKIAAIGVAVKRKVTMHGFALNVDPDLSHFELINPCGLGKPVTSIARLLGRPVSLEEARPEVSRALAATFQVTADAVALSALEARLDAPAAPA